MVIKIKCKCGKLINVQRLTTHDCQFDYREEQRKKIQKNNPVVIAEKIKKI